MSWTRSDCPLCPMAIAYPLAVVRSEPVAPRTKARPGFPLLNPPDWPCGTYRRLTVHSIAVLVLADRLVLYPPPYTEVGAVTNTRPEPLLPGVESFVSWRKEPATISA